MLDGSWDSFWSVIGTVVVIILLLLLPLIWFHVEHDHKSWDKFAAEHNCQEVRHQEETTVMTVLSNGKVGISTLPATTTYRCDDGVEYTRAATELR
jgi:hypothetical protein